MKNLLKAIAKLWTRKPDKITYADQPGYICNRMSHDTKCPIDMTTLYPPINPSLDIAGITALCNMSRSKAEYQRQAHHVSNSGIEQAFDKALIDDYCKDKATQERMYNELKAKVMGAFDDMIITNLKAEVEKDCDKQAPWYTTPHDDIGLYNSKTWHENDKWHDNDKLYKKDDKYKQDIDLSKSRHKPINDK